MRKLKLAELVPTESTKFEEANDKDERNMQMFESDSDLVTKAMEAVKSVQEAEEFQRNEAKIEFASDPENETFVADLFVQEKDSHKSESDNNKPHMETASNPENEDVDTPDEDGEIASVDGVVGDMHRSVCGMDRSDMCSGMEAEADGHERGVAWLNAMMAKKPVDNLELMVKECDMMRTRLIENAKEEIAVIEDNMSMDPNHKSSVMKIALKKLRFFESCDTNDRECLADVWEDLVYDVARLEGFEQYQHA